MKEAIEIERIVAVAISLNFKLARYLVDKTIISKKTKDVIGSITIVIATKIVSNAINFIDGFTECKIDFLSIYLKNISRIGIFQTYN